MLLTGFALGFAPMQWWRSRQPPMTFSISVHRAFVMVSELQELGLPNSGEVSQKTVPNMDALIEQLQSRDQNDPLTGYWSMTVGHAEGDTPFWENGSSRDVPIVKEDGTAAVIQRYTGDKIQFDVAELTRQRILYSFDVENHSPDYRNSKMVGKTQVFPDLIRRLKTQLEIPKNTHIAVAAGKHLDKNSDERELIWIFAASKTEE